MDRDSLQTFLEAHNISLQKWGMGEAKTLDHLLAEINTGEVIITVKDCRVIRTISTAAVNVYYAEETRRLLLVEDRQVFSDGRIRRRNLSTSLGEKVKSGETPEVTAQRAVEEELGVRENLTFIPKPVIEKPSLPSESFPGLSVVNVLYRFDVFLPAQFYKPEGYIEHQADKTTYFIWKLLDDEALQ